MMSLVRLLVKLGSDVNVVDRSGWTPLYQAAQSGSTGKERELSWLLRIHVMYRGSDLYAATAFPVLNWCIPAFRTHISAIIWSLCDCVFLSEIVDLLLSEGARIDIVTESKDTILHASVFGNQPEIMRNIIKAGIRSSSPTLMVLTEWLYVYT